MPGPTAASLVTDWDAYYRRPARLAQWTRRYTGRRLVAAMLRYAGQRPSIAELGGADSCFVNRICRSVEPRAYHVVDNNRLGLDRLRQRECRPAGLELHEQDVRQLRLPEQVDLAFSVGLIEHFGPAETAQIIAAHFAVVRPGGLVILTFPTPTWLYRGARAVAQAAGCWIFHDERPLELGEVEQEVRRHGELCAASILWPLVLTQYLVVCRKRSDCSGRVA